MTRHSLQSAVRAGIPFVINTADGKSHEARQSWKIAAGRTRITPSSHEALWSASPLRRPWPPHRRKNASRLQRFNGFTLLELLIVLSIVAMLMVLIAPAFTTIKSGGDVTGAAYTIKGVLDTARTYAKANNTYVWVGFYEEDVSQSSTTPTATAGIGRIVMSIVASKDGTMLYTSPLTSLVTLPSASLIQVGKLTKIDNVHKKTFSDPTSIPADGFNTRPTPG